MESTDDAAVVRWRIHPLYPARSQNTSPIGDSTGANSPRCPEFASTGKEWRGVLAALRPFVGKAVSPVVGDSGGEPALIDPDVAVGLVGDAGADGPDVFDAAID